METHQKPIKLRVGFEFTFFFKRKITNNEEVGFLNGDRDDDIMIEEIEDVALSGIFDTRFFICKNQCTNQQFSSPYTCINAKINISIINRSV